MRKALLWKLLSAHRIFLEICVLLDEKTELDFLQDPLALQC